MPLSLSTYARFPILYPSVSPRPPPPSQTPPLLPRHTSTQSSLPLHSCCFPVDVFFTLYSLTLGDTQLHNPGQMPPPWCRGLYVALIFAFVSRRPGSISLSMIPFPPHVPSLSSRSASFLPAPSYPSPHNLIMGPEEDGPCASVSGGLRTCWPFPDLPRVVEGMPLLYEDRRGVDHPYTRFYINCPLGKCRHAQGTCGKYRGLGPMLTATHGPKESWAFLGVWAARAADYPNKDEHMRFRPSDRAVRDYLASKGML